MTKGLSLERIRLFWGTSCKYTNVTPHFFLIFEIMEAYADPRLSSHPRPEVKITAQVRAVGSSIELQYV